MKYYQVKYKTEKKGDLVYPASVNQVVWERTQNHFSEDAMIGGTNSKIEADGKSVIELKKEDAEKLIEEYKKSFPKIKDENLKLPGLESTQIAKPDK